MYLNRIFELTKVLDTDKFNIILNRVGGLDETEDGYTDRSMLTKGITVLYRDSRYKKKITLTVNANLLLSCTADADRIIQKLDKKISAYFKKYTLNDFTLTGITVIADIDVGRDKVGDYLTVLNRIGKVKGFTPSEYKGVNGFCLDGNSNHTLFKIYDLERFVQTNTEDNGKRFGGILRTEVQLTKAKAVSEYTDSTDITGQIADIWEKSRDVFMETFVKIVPFGDFCKKETATDIICQNITDLKLRRRMLWLVDLIPEKKSLLLAQKALNYRNVEYVMETFAKINLSPVTIGKRGNVGKLECLYSYLL
ncbi:MAG: hypothetical protein NC253_06850 [Ruminococcus sp.]|nr:hypothetical protein [Ruminococcus sp.]MCM1479978.1 hypothetical protein [Muribaculaceae bacterium]